MCTHMLGCLSLNNIVTRTKLGFCHFVISTNKKVSPRNSTSNFEEMAGKVHRQENGQENEIRIAEGPKVVNNSSENRVFSETRDFRLALLGNVDSGKSTLCGVLSRGLLDDGRGMARSFVLRHQHEQEKGQTSSVAIELLAFSKDEQVIPKTVQTTALNRAKVYHNKDFYEIATAAEHRCTLVDLCGHEKYLKTTIYGLTGMNPNCAMVIVGANHGIQRMTREHIGLCCALKVPFYVVITKVDMCPEQVFKETEMKVKKILKRAGRKAYFIRNEKEDVEKAVTCMTAGNQFAPIFEVSSVSGVGINGLRDFIRKLTVENSVKPFETVETKQEENEQDEINTLVSDLDGLVFKDSKVSKYTEFFVDDTFQVPGVGVVIGGSLRSGSKIAVQDQLLIGPDKNGGYLLVGVKSIQRQCVPSVQVFPGQHATLAIKATASSAKAGVSKLRKNMFHKGMVCVKQSENEEMRVQVGRSVTELNTVHEFEADIKILHHSTTINPGYSPVVHLGVVRQAAVILSIKNTKSEDVVARTGSEVIVRFRFLHAAEYLTIGRAIVFREGRAKGCGNVTRLFPN